MARGTREPPTSAAAIFWWLRKPGDERQLTDCLGELSRIDPKIGRGVAEALLTAAATHGLADRADALLAALPESITCSGEEITGEVTLRPRSWWKPEEKRRGRLDWVFHPPGQGPNEREFQLAVEVKIGAGLRTKQLADYHDHLRDKRGRRGLLVLGRTVPQEGLLDERFEFWLGAVLWEQVLPLLRQVEPADPALQQQWQPFLDVLESRDDLGAEPASWAIVTSPDSRSTIKRAVEQLRPHVEAALRTVVGRRPTARTSARDQFLRLKVKLTKGRVSVDLFVPASDTKRAAQVLLEGTAGGIVLESWVYPQSPRGLLKGERKRSFERAVGSLTARKIDPPFAPAGMSLTRRLTLRPGDEEPREVLAAAIEAEFTTVLQSGVLDENIATA